MHHKKYQVRICIFPSRYSLSVLQYSLQIKSSRHPAKLVGDVLSVCPFTMTVLEINWSHNSVFSMLASFLSLSKFNKLIRRNGLYWLKVLEFSVLGCLSTCFRAYVKGEHHGGSTLWSKLLTSWQPWSKKRKSGRGWGPNIPFKTFPLWPNFLPLGSTC